MSTAIVGVACIAMGVLFKVILNGERRAGTHVGIQRTSLWWFWVLLGAVLVLVGLA